ncbi:hypothetical protein CW298_4532 [Salmonella enterica subsp. enterica serovar Muenchen]|nr:hypothetical protein CFSAN001078_13489 [Salmonella enterica subsp. enterica serovar Manhattan str. CFSAN001078]ESJ75142.1 hypothetical protein CFSAN001075_17628 [Salmonella enterica subsp. enterica serovar Hartford str. CFSAN001075]OSJ83562.1 hypothetical protein K799_07861 [Salmonella enterica subsp. enterica serovar Newport str. SHSN009]PQB13977.1 hypothetical protein CW298_4532 [Salmonella enterica subsp. enterica serovar Muenchen]
MLRAAPWGIKSPRFTNSPLAKRDLEEYLFNECAFHMQPKSMAQPHGGAGVPPLSRP